MGRAGGGALPGGRDARRQGPQGHQLQAGVLRAPVALEPLAEAPGGGHRALRAAAAAGPQHLLREAPDLLRAERPLREDEGEDGGGGGGGGGPPGGGGGGGGGGGLAPERSALGSVVL